MQVCDKNVSAFLYRLLYQHCARETANRKDFPLSEIYQVLKKVEKMKQFLLGSQSRN
jgi:hypothetical protein